MSPYGALYKSTIDELRARTYFTPDFKDLTEYENHIVFIYDSMKHGFPKHEVTDRLEFLGEAATVTDNFVMRKLPSCPITYEVDGKKAREYNWATHVLGHAFVCSAYDIVQLDALMDNGNCHNRVRRWIFMNSQDTPFKGGLRITQPAWMYVATEFYISQIKYGSSAACQIKRDNKNYWDWRHNDLPN